MRYYSEDHEWIDVTGEEATIGIAEYAANNMDDVSYVELPEEDDDFIIGDKLGEIEAGDTVIDIYAPISGTVCMVNDALIDEPELINESPEDKGWVCKMINIDTSELNDMMNEDAYFKYLRKLGL